MSLGRLYWTTSKDVAWTLRSAKREARLRLRARKTRIAQKPVWTMHCSWAHSDWLMEMHRLTWLNLVLRRLFHSLTLLLPVLSVLLFLDVDLLDLSGPLPLPLSRGRLSCGLTQRR